MLRTVLSVMLMSVCLAVVFLFKNSMGFVQKETSPRVVSADISTHIDIEQGTYEDYHPQKLSYAREGKVILFFKADWCASCSVVDEQVLESLEKIPAGVHILKVDFDTEFELRKKYGVTLQHTFVQVDEFGNMRAKWSNGQTLTDILEKTI